jgi:hypothetical protein
MGVGRLAMSPKTVLHGVSILAVQCRLAVSSARPTCR